MADYVASGLREEGHGTDIANDGLSGLELVMTRSYDALVVDRMLPGLDGLSLVRALRSSGKDVPVLFLTSVGGVDDRVEGLEAGADDYLLKPFAFSELLARLNALIRRAPVRREEVVLEVGDLKINLVNRTVSRGGTIIELQPREFKLLEYLMRNRGRVLTRTMLLERVWNFHFDPRTNVVETHISRLRTKVDRPFKGEMIRTVRGAGYVLEAAS
ncbi:two-component system, OmpR family, response regulator [Faunimonas pinastri]|uniref:Two-component system, OmpR family, response regulator n=2 Tax=Faunimonas pinastri TaxID=1855383 RepID=A0A1H9QUY9_9HYPH|nr:two-component system, OmpR family, response regulator [Faunimonas pinastri]